MASPLLSDTAMRVLAILVLLTSLIALGDPKDACDEVRHRRYTAHFERVELTKLAQTMSDATCRSFIVAENVKGTISLIGPENGTQTLDVDQFYAAFLASLDANGFTVVKQGRYFRIIDKKAARQHPVPLTFEASEYPAPDEVVTRVFKVKNAELEVIRAVLGQLISPNGDLISALPDLLIATDVVSNLQRLEKLLPQLDVARPNDVMRLITLRHADAADVADKVNRMLTPKAAPRVTETLTTSIDERTNRLMVIASPALLARVEDLVAQLDVEVPGDGRARVYRLKNADAKDIAAALEGMTQGSKAKAGAPNSPGGLSGDVRITATEAQNALVIVASAGDYRSLVEVIEQLDVPVRQVFIETMIMEVNLSHETVLGVAFHGLGSTGTDATTASTFVLGSQPAGSPSSTNLTGLATSSGLLAGLQGPVLAQVSKALGISIPSFGISLQANQTDSDVNVMSTPHIMTSDNKEAVITVGQKIPFQSGISPAQLASLAASGTAATTTAAAYGASITREKVELKLTVKPHIGDGDTIRLEIDQQAEELASGNTAGLGPITSTRGQKTTVVAHDAETLVLGGIMQDREIESVSKVPVLGDIPLIGRLFRHTDKTKTKVNLLVFLTPHIIREQRDFQQVMDRKMEERRKLMEQFYGERPEVSVTIDYTRKRGPLSALFHAVEAAERLPENGGAPLAGDTLLAPQASNAL